MSGRPIYGWRPVAPPTVSLEQIRAAIAEAVASQTYARLYREFGFDIPALLPQVYLHYDPYSQRPGRPSTAEE